MMKLRIRSVATKETMRIEAPDPCSLGRLKTLVARALSLAAFTPSIPPESIRLSLNRNDELLPSSADDSLHSLGLTSGDLLYFSLAPASQTLAPSSAPVPEARSNMLPVPPFENSSALVGTPVGLKSQTLTGSSSLAPASQTLAPSSVPVPEARSNMRPVPPFENSSALVGTPVGLKSQTLTGSSSLAPASEEIAESSIVWPVPPLDGTGARDMESDPPQEPPQDRMDVDVEPMVGGKSLSVPCFLKRVMEAEKGEAEGILGRLVVTIQAVFLESGFVVNDGSSSDGSRLPAGWVSKVTNFLVQYTLPELVGALDGKNAKMAILRFSAMGNYATVYGFLSGDHPDVYRVCFDLSKLAPLLSSSMNCLSDQEEKEVFALWKIVKDGLSLPLLIDICQKNGFPSPACFMRLPTDLKTRIMDFLSGTDVSKIGCTCTELRYLSSNDDLWKKKFVEEFGLVDERVLAGRSWKDKYANYWIRRKNAEKRTEKDNIFRLPNIFAPRFNPVGPQRFPMLGGDYDRFPAIGGLAPVIPRLGFPRLLTRRNYSPDCNLGGYDASFR